VFLLTKQNFLDAIGLDNKDAEIIKNFGLMFTRELVKCSPRAEIRQMSRILVVEDEDLIREMLVLALKAEVMRSQPLLMGEPLWRYSEC